MKIAIFKSLLAIGLSSGVCVLACCGTVQGQMQTSGVFTGACTQTPYAALADGDQLLVGFDVPYFEYGDVSSYSDLGSNVLASSVWSNSLEAAIVDVVKAVGDGEFYDVDFNCRYGDDARSRFVAFVATNSAGVTNHEYGITLTFETYYNSVGKLAVHVGQDLASLFHAAIATHPCGDTNFPSYSLMNLDRAVLVEKEELGVGRIPSGSVRMYVACDTDYYRSLDEVLGSKPHLAELVSIALAAQDDVTNFIETAYTTNGFSGVFSNMLNVSEDYRSLMKLLQIPEQVRLIAEIGGQQRRIVFLQSLYSSFGAGPAFSLSFVCEGANWRLLPYPDWDVVTDQPSVPGSGPILESPLLLDAVKSVLQSRMPCVEFEQDNISVGQAQNTIRPVVVLSWPASNDVSVTVTMMSVVGGAETNFHVVTTNLLFEKGTLIKTAEVAVVHNDLGGQAITATLKVDVAGGGAIVRDRGILPMTIQNIDMPPIVFFPEQTITAKSVNNAVVVPISLSWATTNSVEVCYHEVATQETNDISTLTSNVAVFLPGETSANIILPLRTNVVATEDRFIGLSITAARGATVGSPSSCGVVVEYISSNTVVGFANAYKYVYRGMNMDPYISVVLSKPYSVDLDVPVLVVPGGSATNGVDFTLGTNIFHFIAGSTNALISLSVGDFTEARPEAQTIFTLGTLPPSLTASAVTNLELVIRDLPSVTQ